MRVISGDAGGLRLIAPAGETTRPTTDRVKEALFSIIDSSFQLQDSEVLDLFAGSGALSVEALSRGAAHATLVEKSRQAIAAIRKNIEHTGVSNRTTILCMDVFTALEQLARQNRKFDLIILDPPYAAGLHAKVILEAADLLKSNGLLIAEAAARNPLPKQLGRCSQYNRRIYGDTALEFYHLEQSDAT